MTQYFHKPYQQLFHTFLLCCLIWLSNAQAEPNSHTKLFLQFSQWFTTNYQELNIQPLVLSYVDNINSLPSPDSAMRQRAFFNTAQQRLNKIPQSNLNSQQLIDYGVAQFEIKLNLKKLELINNAPSESLDDDHQSGIYHISQGKQWYTYYLQRWLGATVNPDDIYAFGLRQITIAEQQIELIRLATGLSKQAFSQKLQAPDFFSSDQVVIQKRFEQLQSTVEDNLSQQFFAYPDVPIANIKQGDNPELSQVPGYYNGQTGTFYYNLFDEPYNRRESDWLYLHEAVPGHHFQNSIAQSQERTELQQLFIYYGFREGWAAYTEQLGKSLGLYQDHYAELGRWEWDIVRSVRVALDVGINYYGWTDKQALDFWGKHINDDAIGQREIQRMRRWPAQVITYKYGAEQITHWKNELQLKHLADFDVRLFHDHLLTHGPLPMHILQQQVMSNNNNFCTVDVKENNQS